MTPAMLIRESGRLAGALTCGVILVVGGCGSPTSPPSGTDDGQPAQTSPSAPVAAPAASDRSDERYEGPPFEMIVEGQGGIGAQRIDIAVTVLTGGWLLQLDESRSNVEGDIKRIYATLEGPNETEMVTQALETKRGSITLGGVGERVELWVRVLRRGDTNDSPPFRLAATSE